MKLTSLATLMLAFSSAAFAQAPSAAKAPSPRAVSLVSPAADSSATSVSAIARAPAAPVAPAGEANPFTGKSMAVEQIQQRLEESKLLTATLEESLKQTNLTEELRNVPLRKAVEASQARTNIKKEETTQAALDQQARAAADAERLAKAASKPVAAASSPKKGSKVAVTPERPVAVEAPRLAKPTLLSVMDVSGAKSVVMDFGGSTLVATDGEMTPVGPVRVLDSGSANIGGEIYKVRSNTLSRFVVSDPKLDPKANSSGTAAYIAPNNVGAPAGAMGLPSLPGQVASATPPGMLPPLQLPPGLKSLPAPR